MRVRMQRPGIAVIAGGVLLAAFALFWLLRTDAVRTGSLEQRDLTEFDIGGVPRAVTTSSDGVWVARADQTVLKLDPRTGDRLAKVRLPFLPGQMIVAGGTVWVGAIEGTSVARLNPRNAKLLDQIEVGTTPQSLAADADSVYVAAFDDGVVKHLDAASGEVMEEVYGDGDAFPSSVVPAFDAVWVSDVVGDVVTRVGTAPGDPREIAVGDSPTRLLAAEESIWVANFNGRSVTRIDPEDDTSSSEILVGGKPGAIAAGGGFILVLRPSTDDFVLIDAAAGRWTGTAYEVAEAPQDVAAGDGYFWIPSQAGTLTRVPFP